MKKKTQGFTIIELVIVIAIVAILAAVTVTSYTGIIEKANLVHDQQAIRSLNEILAIAAASDPPATAGDAIGMLSKLGIYGDQLSAHTDGFQYVYNLAENQFYLAKETGDVVYPEDTDKANLWALYTDDPDDKLPGFTNYVATGTVANQDALTAVFGDGASYRFDLQKSGFLQGELGSNVTIVQGFVSAASTTVHIQGSAQELVKTSIVSGKNKYENELVTFEMSGFGARFPADAVFYNCVILPGSKTTKITSGAVFENCTFVGFSNWAITAAGPVTIQNCTFINCQQGINIQAYTGAVVIVGNTFHLSAGSGDANAIQIGGSSRGDKSETKWDDAFSLTVRNNTFVSGNAAILIHSVNQAADNPVNPDHLSGRVTFSGNTFGELTAGKVARKGNSANEVALYEFFCSLIP